MMLLLLLSTVASASPELCDAIRFPGSDVEEVLGLLEGVDPHSTCTYSRSSGGSRSSWFGGSVGTVVAIAIVPPVGLSMLASSRQSSTKSKREVSLVDYAILRGAHHLVRPMVEAGAQPSEDDALTWAVMWQERDLVEAWAGRGLTLSWLRLPADRNTWAAAVSQLNELGVALPCRIPDSGGAIPDGYLRQLEAGGVPPGCLLHRMGLYLPDADFDRLLEQFLRDRDNSWDADKGRQVAALRLARASRWNDVDRVVASGLSPCSAVVLKMAFLTGELDYLDKYLSRHDNLRSCSTDDRGKIAYTELHTAAYLGGPAGFDLLDAHGIGPASRPAVVREGLTVDVFVGREATVSGLRYGYDARLIQSILAHPDNEPTDAERWGWLVEATPGQFGVLVEHAEPAEDFVVQRVREHDERFVALIDAGLPPRPAYLDAAIAEVLPTHVIALYNAGLEVPEAAWHDLTCAFPRLDIWLPLGVPLSSAPCVSGDPVNLIEPAVLSPKYLPLLAERGLALNSDAGAAAMDATVRRFRSWERGMHAGDRNLFVQAVRAGVPYTLSLAVLFADECEPLTIEALPPAWRSWAERRAVVDAAPRSCRSAVSRATRASERRFR